MGKEKLGTLVRRKQILETAMSLVSAHGLKGLGVAKITNRIGIVPSGFYRHFKGMNDLLDEILEMIHQRLLSNVENIRRQTPDCAERLHLLLTRHVRMIRENKAIPKVIFSEEVYGGSSLRRQKLYGIIEDQINKISEIIAEGQENSQFRPDIEPEAAAVMFLGMIQPAAILWDVSDGKFDITRHSEKAWRIFRNMLTPE